MKENNYLISIGGFLGGSVGVWFCLWTHGNAFWESIFWGIYWGFLFGMIAKIVESIVFRNPIISKLGDYFQSWGAVGTFIGLIIMTGKIGECLNGGETGAIKEQLAGFSVCFLTSLIGVCFAIFTSMIADALGAGGD